MRAVLDANILVSALIAPAGAPAEIVSRWRAGAFELVVSAQLLDEFAQTLGYPKLRKRVPAGDAATFVELLRSVAIVGQDAAEPARLSPDPGDDYLLALAAAERALLVSGDRHLLSLADRFPIHTVAEFLGMLHASG